MKHVLLLQLVRGMQRKEKGFLYLDTHAGRGRYDLTTAARGDSLARKPEHPDGIGRLANATSLLAPLADYVALVRAFDGSAPTEPLRYYPGSPWMVQALARPQDRLALCEKHPEEVEELRVEFGRQRRVSIHAMDGYQAMRAMLPPPEKRALVLIDPPFEAQDEFRNILDAIEEGLRRLPAATIGVWYPITARARVDEFLDALVASQPPPTFTAELLIAGEEAPLKMKGCGLLVINPPWQIDAEIVPSLDVLAGMLSQAPGGFGRLRWLVNER
jgi:Protein involved in catabolism of external DNA